MARYGCTITVATGQIPSSQSNFSWVATEANFPPAAIDGGAQSIQNGGGNLRCYTDSTKAIQIPIEIPAGSFVTGVSPSIVVWGLSPTLAVGGTVYIEADTVATAQPAASNTYGSEKVWVGEYFSSLDGGFTDSSGNIVPVAFGGITGGGAAGNLGDATAYDGVDDEFSIDTIQTAVQGLNNVAVSVWAYPTAYGTAGKAFISQICGDNAGVSDGTVAMRIGSDGTDANKNKAYFQVTTTAGRLDVTSSGTLPLNVWSLITGVLESDGDIKLYVNGTLSNTNITGSTKTIQSTHTGSYRLGDEQARGRNYTGVLSSVRFLGEQTPTQVTSEYNNQSSPSTFWDTGAWEDQDASITITESTVNTNYTVLSPTITLTGSISITESLVNANYAALNPTVTLTGSISITESAVNTSYTSLNPSIDLTGIIAITEQVVNTSYNALNPVVTLTSTAIQITESTVNAQYATLDPSILLTPEPIGIVSTVCFNGELVEISYNGKSTNLEYNGQSAIIEFNGEFNDLEFNGTIQTTCNTGSIKTNC